MKKQLKQKLSLNRETLRALQEGGLRDAAGGFATINTCGKPCTNACTVSCRTQCGGPGCL